MQATKHSHVDRRKARPTLTSLRRPAWLGQAHPTWGPMQPDRDVDAFVAWSNRKHPAAFAAILGLTLWAGALFGWWMCVVGPLSLFIAMSMTNAVVRALGGPFPLARLVGWGWLLLAAAGLTLETVRPTWTVGNASNRPWLSQTDQLRKAP